MRRVNYSYDISKKLTQRKNLTRSKRKINNRKINKVERKLWKILGESFAYNGCGPKKIAGKCPDFIDESRKIIVECYGNYWHKADTLKKTLDRINLFAEAGYKTVIVWENEVNESTVTRKLSLI